MASCATLFGGEDAVTELVHLGILLSSPLRGQVSRPDPELSASRLVIVFVPMVSKGAQDFKGN